MRIRLVGGVVVAVAASLALVGTLVRAQTQRWSPLAEPVVLSGPDVGFRVEWMNGRVPTGQVVVRLNGQWVEARIGEPSNTRVVPAPPPGLPAPPARPAPLPPR